MYPPTAKVARHFCSQSFHWGNVHYFELVPSNYAFLNVLNTVSLIFLSYSRYLLDCAQNSQHGNVGFACACWCAHKHVLVSAVGSVPDNGLNSVEVCHAFEGKLSHIAEFSYWNPCVKGLDFGRRWGWRYPDSLHHLVQVSKSHCGRHRPCHSSEWCLVAGASGDC